MKRFWRWLMEKEEVEKVVEPPTQFRAYDDVMASGDAIRDGMPGLIGAGRNDEFLQRYREHVEKVERDIDARKYELKPRSEGVFSQFHEYGRGMTPEKSEPEKKKLPLPEVKVRKGLG